MRDPQQARTRCHRQYHSSFAAQLLCLFTAIIFHLAAKAYPLSLEQGICDERRQGSDPRHCEPIPPSDEQELLRLLADATSAVEKLAAEIQRHGAALGQLQTSNERKQKQSLSGGGKAESGQVAISSRFRLLGA